jgi:hypothetical protein
MKRDLTKSVQKKAKELEDAPLRKDGGDRRSEKARLELCDNSDQKSRGTNSTYLTRRIARDRPDILQRMKEGEFSSVQAAAREAGIVEKSRLIWLSKDPAKAAERIQNQLGADYLEDLISVSKELLEE